MPAPVQLPALAELLASIPSMIGERPHDRVVIVTLGSTAPLDVYSHALPWRGDRRMTIRVARELAMAAVESGGTDSILIAVFCRSTSGGTVDRPYEQLQHLVADAAHQHNIHLAESFYVAANGWGSYCCDDPRCEYAGPRPITELEEWAASAGLTF